MHTITLLMKGLVSKTMYIAGQIDFYDSEAHAGDSILPFVGFMMFLFGLVAAFIGFVKINNAKRQWNLFYDYRDKKDLAQDKYVKEKKIGTIILVAGIALLVGSFLIL